MSRTIRRASIGVAVATAAALAFAPAAHARPLDPVPVSQNRTPTALPQSVTVAENTLATVTLKGTDPDAGDALAYSTQTSPAHGTLSDLNAAAGTVKYLPARDYQGTDSFTFRVNDGDGYSAAATVSVTVSPGDSYPSAVSKTVAVGQDNPFGVPVALDSTDPDGTSGHVYSIVSGPKSGRLDADGDSVRRYIPAKGFTGTDSFTYLVTDPGGLKSDAATITITVVPAVQADRPPVADAKSLQTTKDTALDVTLSGSDADGDKLAFVLLSDPANGTLSGSVPTLRYTPKPGYLGTDTFEYRVEARGVLSSKAVVSIAVVAPTGSKPNAAPVADNLVRTTVTNRPVGVQLTGSDADKDALTFAVATQPAHGTLSGDLPNLVYTPEKDFRGVDAFTYTASDKTATSAPATVKIVVRGYQHRPIAYSQAVTTGRNHAVRIELDGWTRDRGDLDYVVVDRPDHGRLIQDGDEVVYKPYRGFVGHDAFRFVVRDEDGVTSRPATVLVKVKRYWYGGHHHR